MKRILYIFIALLVLGTARTAFATELYLEADTSYALHQNVYETPFGYPKFEQTVTATATGTASSVDFYFKTDADELIWSVLDTTSGAYFGSSCGVDDFGDISVMQHVQVPSAGNSFHVFTHANINTGDQLLISIYGAKTGCTYYTAPQQAYVETYGPTSATTTFAFGIRDAGGGDLVDEVIDPNATRIISILPETGSTVGNDVTFSVHAYINPDDVGNIVKIQMELQNYDQNVLLLGILSPSQKLLFFGLATTSGHWYFSTTTVLGDGNYRFNVKMDSCASALGFCIIHTPFFGIHISENTQFIVNNSTFIGNISQLSFQQVNGVFASTTATSTEVLAQTCNPISGFDPIQCLAFLFIPDAGYLRDSMELAKEGIFTRFPLGYFTRLISIFASTATTSLPSYTTSLRIGAGSDMTPEITTLTFDMDDMLAGGGDILESTRDPIYNKNIRDITEPWVQAGFAISVLFTIVFDLVGLRKNDQMEQGREKTKLS